MSLPAPLIRGFMTKGLNELAEEILAINEANGWRTTIGDDWRNSDYIIPTCTALIASEVSEMLEAFRKDDFTNYCEEMADVIIRVLHHAAGLSVDIEAEVLAKMEKNRHRGIRHGGKEFDMEFVVLDTETTGLNRYRRDEAVEISVIGSDGTVLFDSLIKPKLIADWDEAARIHGISA